MKVLATLAAIALSLAGISNARAGATAAEVEVAITKAKQWLYANQKGGNWELRPTPASPVPDDNKHDGGQWGGLTAIAVYALLDAGESPRDERLAPAVEFLKKADLRGTYALAMRCQVWLLLPKTPENTAGLRRDAAALIAAMKTQGPAAGLWDYTGSPKPAEYSHSRSQYAVLGLWAATQRDVETPLGAWQMIEAAWLRNADASGGWTYKAPRSTPYACTPGMTAAGVATLFLTGEMLHVGEAAGQRNPAAPALAKGLEWLTKNADKYAADNRYARDFPYPTLYTFERAAQASGYKYLGGVDWFEKGSAWTLRKQNKDGSWYSGDSWTGIVPDTCFAMLFLLHGRAPVLYNKLQYSITTDGKMRESSWNQRPRDIANATRWVGRQMEKRVGWQIVPLSAPVDDLQESSVLCISGKDALGFTPEETAKLKTYVESGGLILGLADGSSELFNKSFRHLGASLFGGEFRQLPDSHPIYTRQQFPFAAKDRHPNVEALTNGVRELMLLIPQGDPGLMWQGNRTAAGADLFNFAADLGQYAIDRQYRYRSETHVVTADPKITPTREIMVARIKYDGNWDPEPAAWRQMAATMHNKHKIKIRVDSVDFGSSLDKYAVAHLTGTAKVPLSPEKSEWLKAFVTRGGVLIVDAAGGSEAFSESTVRDLSVAFGESMRELSGETPVVQTLKKLETPLYRRFARASQGPGIHLFGMEDKGKVKLIVSALDLTAGMMGQPVDGVRGYEPAAATAIVEQCLLGTLSPATTSAPKPDQTTKPATAPKP